MRSSTATFRRWVTIIALVVLIVSVVVWLAGRERLPGTIVIATGGENGLYHELGTEIRGSITERLDRDVVVRTTEGSLENHELLRGGAVELAIVQGGSVDHEDLSIVTPLFPELVFVIVRKSSGISTIPGLAGRRVALGHSQSGSRVCALQLLRYYGIPADGLEEDHRGFTELLTDPKLDAAVVVAGISSPDLERVLDTGEFAILPIETAPAIDMASPFYREYTVPAGLFSVRPRVPDQPIATLATNAFLMVRPDAPDALVRAALGVVHEESLRLDVPTLISRHEAPHWAVTRLHPTAKRFFHPTDDIGTLAAIMESLAATKELLFALGAAVYLLWLRWRRIKARENEELIREQKEHLDVSLEEALRIEEAQMETDDPAEIERYLDEVSRIRLRILHEFTEEEVRGDQAFTIVVDQCGSLILKLQQRLLLLSSK